MGRQKESFMRYTLAISVLALAACSSDKSDTKATGTSATVSISGTILDTKQTPLEGVKVCLDTPPGVECATTDAKGKGTLSGIPKSTRIRARVTRADFLSVITHGNTDDKDIKGAQIQLLSEADADKAFETLKLTKDSSKGHILFATATDVTLETKVADVSVSTTTTSGKFVFVNAALGPDDALTATSTAGAGGIVNVDPGNYEMTFSHASKKCVDGYAWPAKKQPEKGVTVQVPVEAGWVTFVAVFCG